MKRLFGSLLLGLSMLCAQGADILPNVLCINRTDGIRETLQLDPAMVVKFLPEQIQITHPKILVEYALDDVASFSYAYVEDSELYHGSHQVALEEISASERNISISAEEIIVSGVDDLVIYDLRGVEQGRAKSDGASATLSISSLPKGVYIVKSGSLVLKVTL